MSVMNISLEVSDRSYSECGMPGCLLSNEDIAIWLPTPCIVEIMSTETYIWKTQRAGNRVVCTRTDRVSERRDDWCKVPLEIHRKPRKEM